MAEYEDDVYSEEDTGAGTVSPLQMLMMGYSTVTPEGKAKASEVFGDLYGKRGSYDEDEQSAYDEYESQARAARDTLRRAREVLAAKKTPTTKWLEVARGFGAPTRAGSFAESISNYAGERIPGRQREAEWEANRDNQLLQFDQGVSEIDQQLALNKLKLRQARRAADDKLMIEAMKIMGKPVPQAKAPPKDAPRVAQEALDKAYVKDYVDFITQGASTASGDIAALKAANRVLKGTRIDPETGEEVQGKRPTTISGPVIGLFPKVLRDIFTPKGSATQEDVESVAQKALKTVLGPQFTAVEGERFLARVYNPRFEEHVNARRVERLLDQIERAYAEKVRAAQYFQENGTLRGYKGRTTWSMDMFDPDIPEGQSPMDVIQGEIEDIQGEPTARPAPQRTMPPHAAAPDEGMEEIPIEALLPAGMAKGGKVKQAGRIKTAIGDVSQQFLDEVKSNRAAYVGKLREAMAKGGHDPSWLNEYLPGRSDEILAQLGDDWLTAPGPYVLSDAELGRVPPNFNAEGARNLWQDIVTNSGIDFGEVAPPADDKEAIRWILEHHPAKPTLGEIEAELLKFRGRKPKSKKPKLHKAEGGVVEGEFPDGRPRFRMPDGKIVRARPGDDYETVLQIYTNATGTAPTRPGLPPQQIPSRMGGQEGPGPATQIAPAGAPAPRPQPPMMAAQAEEPPSFTDVAMEELPSSMAYTAAGAAGAGIGDKLLTATGDRLIPGRRETPAQRRILDMLAEQRRTPAMVAAGVRQQQKMGIPAMAMDDPALRTTADSVLPETGLQNASTILQRLRDRAEGAGERTMERVNENLKPDPYFDQLDKLRDNLYTNSKPLYQQAYAANPAVSSKVLPHLLDTPDGKKAVKMALRIMRNEGKKIGKQDAMGMVTKPSLEFLDYVKRGMDQLITKEEGTGVNYQATELGKSMRALRNALRDELDVATTPKKGESLYKKAREQYAGDLEVLDALQTGRSEFTKLQPQELQKRFNTMSFAEKDAFRTGAAQAIFEQIESPTGDFNAARKVIGSAAMRKKLRPMFDTDKQYELFETALKREAELYELDKKSMRRAEAGQEQHAQPAPGPVKRLAKHVPRLGIKSPTMWALQYIRNNSEATEKKMDDVLEHLKASTPEELADLEKTLGPKYSRRISRKGRAAKTAVAGALAGAAYRVATGAEPDEEGDHAEQE